jgi:hypothetical protein
MGEDALKKSIGSASIEDVGEERELLNEKGAAYSSMISNNPFRSIGFAR